MSACLRHPEMSASIRLWDGREHCVACVEAACPGLADFAKGRDCLEDGFVFSKEEAHAAWAKMSGLMCGVFALVSIGIFVSDFGLALLFVGAGGFVLAFTMTIMYLNHVRFPRAGTLPTVRVKDGVVSVFRPAPAGARRPMTTFPLSEAHWHLGRFSEDDFRHSFIPDRPAIILRAPRKWAGVAPPSEKNATGSTPEMIRLWQGFLTLAGVPEVSQSKETKRETYGIMILGTFLLVFGLITLVSGKVRGRGNVPVEGPVAVYVGALLVVVSLGVLIATFKKSYDSRRKDAKSGKVVKSAPYGWPLHDLE